MPPRGRPRSRRLADEEVVKMEDPPIEENDSDSGEQDEDEDDEEETDDDGDDGDDDADEDEDGDDEDDEDEESEEEIIERRVLPARANRGSKMADLMAKAEDESSEFWQANKEVFAEDEVDSDFEASELSDDIVDEDFDLPEEDAGEDDEEKAAALAEKEELARERGSRKKGYVDPALARKRAGIDASEEKEDKPAPVKRQRKVYAVINEDRLNRPLRKAAIAAAEAREQEKGTKAARKVPKERVKSEYRVLTQEEQLMQARETEIYNRYSLEELLRVEEAQKRVTARKPVHNGPTIVMKTSQKGKLHQAVQQSVVFQGCTPFSYITNAERQTYKPPHPSPANPEVNVRMRRNFEVTPCVITGLPAKYRDRVTGLPFANAEAFKKLREVASNPQFNKDHILAQLYHPVAVSAVTAVPVEPVVEPAAVLAQAGLVGPKKRGRKKAGTT